MSQRFARCVVLLAVCVPAQLASGQAPDRGSGPVTVSGFVRVIDGDTIEVRANGRRVGVGLIGVRAPQGNTACGRVASQLLQTLVGSGLLLDEDLELTFDERGRRMYYGLVGNRQSVAREIVRAGVARADGRGRERAELEAEEAEARRLGRGCLWGGRP